MSQEIPYFDLPLNLPHAATIADRIIKKLAEREEIRMRTRELASSIAAHLMFYRGDDDNPPADEAEEVRQAVLVLARQMVDRFENEGIQGDKLGQLIRNLFECLAEGREGAVQSLRAGENPESAQRPWRPPNDSP